MLVLIGNGDKMDDMWGKGSEKEREREEESIIQYRGGGEEVRYVLGGETRLKAQH
jgi:hypothetical protein